MLDVLNQNNPVWSASSVVYSWEYFDCVRTSFAVELKCLLRMFTVSPLFFNTFLIRNHWKRWIKVWQHSKNLVYKWHQGILAANIANGLLRDMLCMSGMLMGRSPGFEFKSASGVPAKTRYCGHLNSRLKRARSNSAKQARSAYYMKESWKSGKAEHAIRHGI